MIVNANDVSNPATLVPFVVKIREKSSRLRFPLAVPAPAAALGIDDGGRSRKSHNEMPLPPLSLSLCLCVLKLAIFPSLSAGDSTLAFSRYQYGIPSRQQGQLN